MQRVLNGQTANLSPGAGTIVRHNGGEMEVVVSGTFDSSTLTLYGRYDGTSTWVRLKDAVWTEPDVILLRTVRPCDLSFGLASAGGSTSLTAWI